jgi:hypothetical protein
VEASLAPWACFLVRFMPNKHTKTCSDIKNHVYFPRSIHVRRQWHMLLTDHSDIFVVASLDDTGQGLEGLNVLADPRLFSFQCGASPRSPLSYSPISPDLPFQSPRFTPPSPPNPQVRRALPLQASPPLSLHRNPTLYYSLRAIFRCLRDFSPVVGRGSYGMPCPCPRIHR